MFPPVGNEGEGMGGPPPPLPGMEEEAPGAATNVTACAAKNCTNNEDGKCGLPEIRVGADADCASFEGERTPKTEGPEGAPAGAPRGPLTGTVPPPPAPAARRG
jgi:hypothetical protein